MWTRYIASAAHISHPLRTYINEYEKPEQRNSISGPMCRLEFSNLSDRQIIMLILGVKQA